MTVGATLVASLLATLSRPATWLLALATFLLRGGFLFVLAPIIVLPSAVALGNILTPLLSTIVFQGFTPSIVAMLATVAVVALLWLVGIGLVAAATESELIAQVGTDDETWPTGRPPIGFLPGRRDAWRVLAVRILAQLPLVVALAWGAARIVTVAYQELTAPSDVVVALVIRVAAGASDAVVAVLIVWLVGETVGSIAARRVTLLGEGVARALRGAALALLRQPLRCAALALVSLVPLVLVLVVVGLAGSATWDALRAALGLGADPVVALTLVLALVALFSGGLLLIGVCSAWRGAIWTVEVAGTFGATAHDPEGHWMDVPDSGTLTDLRPRGVDPDTR